MACSWQEVLTFLIRLHCWVAMGTWLPSTPSLYKCTSHCSGSRAMSYNLRGSREGKKPLEKSSLQKRCNLNTCPNLVAVFFQQLRDFIIFHIFSTCLKISPPHEEEKHSIFLQLGMWVGKPSNVYDSENDSKSLHLQCSASMSYPARAYWWCTSLPLHCVILTSC